MPVEFVAYIDESGDTGIEKIKPFDTGGASEWLVLSCTLVRVEHDTKLVSWVKEILSQFRNNQAKHLHFNELIAPKKKIACEVLASKPCLNFVVMSNKKNIKGYKNPNLDDGNRAWIYWWLTRLLLERVTKACATYVPDNMKGKQKLKIVFSRRGRLRYIDFHNYLKKLYKQSRMGTLVLTQGDIDWSVIDFEEVFVIDHKQRAGLQLADIVAGAFFQAVERNRPADCDSTFAKILKPRMARNRNGQFIDHGLKTMPDIWQMDLHPTQRELFEHYGYNKEGW